MLGLPSFKYFIFLFLLRLFAQEKLAPAPRPRKAGSGSSLKKSWLRLLAQEKLAQAPRSRKAGYGSLLKKDWLRLLDQETDTPKHTSHRGSQGFQSQLTSFFVVVIISFFPKSGSILINKNMIHINQYRAIFVPRGEKYISVKCFIPLASIICYVLCLVPYGEQLRKKHHLSLINCKVWYYCFWALWWKISNTTINYHKSLHVRSRTLWWATSPHGSKI